MNIIGTETLLTSQVQFPADNSTKKSPECACSAGGPTDCDINRTLDTSGDISIIILMLLLDDSIATMPLLYR